MLESSEHSTAANIEEKSLIWFDHVSPRIGEHHFEIFSTQSQQKHHETQLV